MAWRVGGEGLRVIHSDGSESLLPAGSVIAELPERFVGTLELIDPAAYDDKTMQPGDYEDKSL